MLLSLPPSATASTPVSETGDRPETVTVAAEELVGAKVVLAVMLTTTASEAVGSPPSTLTATFWIGVTEIRSSPSRPSIVTEPNTASMGELTVICVPPFAESTAWFPEPLTGPTLMLSSPCVARNVNADGT